MGRIAECPLCRAIQTEIVLAQNKDFIIVRTKTIKGN